MPDGDRVHTKLPGYYQKSYKILCESNNINSIADIILESVLKELKDKFSGIPISLLSDCYNIVSEFSQTPENTHVLFSTIDKIILNHNAPKEIRLILSDSLKVSIDKYLSGNSIFTFENMVFEFLFRFSNVRFFERVPMKNIHLNNKTEDDINKSLYDSSILVRQGLFTYAQRLAKNPTKNIRRPKFTTSANITAETNLLAGY